MFTVEQIQLMKQLNTNPLDINSLGDWRFAEGYIGKGSYGLVRLGFRQQQQQTTKASSEEASDSSSDRTYRSSGEETSSYEDTPKSFENSLESLTKNHPDTELVAVKLFDKSKILEKKVTESLKNEVNILKELNGHNNIIKFKEVVEDQSVYGIVTEYASGGDLLDFIKSQQKVSECQAKPMFRQIVSAVCYAHKKHIVHRDLKAENIFLTNDLTVKIGDWGLAAKYDPNNTINKVCGSIHYASPEIIQGKQYVGPEIDVWSLGVLLYAITTGTLPFFGNDKDIKHRICRAKYQCPAYLSNSLVQLIEWMLQPNPILRCRLKDIIHHPWLRPVSAIPRFISYHHKANHQHYDDEDEYDLTSSTSSFSSSEEEEEEVVQRLPTAAPIYSGEVVKKPVIAPIAILANCKAASPVIPLSCSPAPLNCSVSTLLSPKSSGAMSPQCNSPPYASPPLASPKGFDPKKKKKFSIDKLVGKVKGLVCELVSGATAPKPSSVYVSPI